MGFNKYFKQREGSVFWRDIGILTGVVLVVFLGSLILLGEGLGFISPDEVATAFFAELFANTGQLRAFESLNVPLGDALHPRSIVSVNGWLVPVGFIGLPVLAGFVGMLIGEWVIVFLTPLIAALAVFAWYGIVSRFLNRHMALLSAILLALHPAWWYYSARTLMPNVPFVSFLIFGIFFLVARPFGSTFSAWLSRVLKMRLDLAKTWVRELDWVLGGGFFGLALFIRPSEVLWVGLAACLVGFIYRSELSWRQLVLFGLSVVLAISPMFFVQRATYGKPLQTGYTIEAQTSDQEQGDVDASVAPQEGQEISAYDRFQAYVQPVMPFGLHPRSIARNVVYYGLGLFWWLSILSAIGLVLLWPRRSLRKVKRRRRTAYIAALGLVSIWLVAMYGSWTIHDNPDPTSITIANSYVRYWLPMFVAMTPLIALGIRWIYQRAVTDRAKTLLFGILFVSVAALNIRAVFFAPEDGLLQVRETLERNQQIRQEVLSLTEEDAIIVVDRGDKLFFPDRRVRYPLRSEQTYQLMPQMVRREPLYYFGITFPREDLTYLNDRKLKELGLWIDRLETFGERSLYRIYER